MQVIPHITNEIRAFIERGAASHDGKADVALVEIGGTVGDIESLPFLEAARQMSLRMGRNHAAFVHLTLVPFIASAGELKTKPTQHSVQKLREIGISPTALLCRADRPIPDDERAKISLFANIPQDAVISVWDADSIYKIPQMLNEQGLDRLICEELRRPEAGRPVDVAAPGQRPENPQHEITIGMVGKYVDLTESYKSLIEALRHAGMHTATRVNIEYIDSEELESGHLEVLAAGRHPVPGGFGKRGTEGKIRAIQYARENKVPYRASARHAAGRDRIRPPRGRHGRCELHRVQPRDRAPGGRADHRVGGPRRRVEQRSADSDRAAPCAGAQRVPVREGTKAAQIYGAEVNERHRHRYEVNNHYVPQLEQAGMVISARTPTENLPEMMELPDSLHPWFVGVQFHPEFTSTRATATRCSRPTSKRHWPTSSARQAEAAAGRRER